MLPLLNLLPTFIAQGGAYRQALRAIAIAQTVLHDLCKVPQRQSLRFVFIIFTLQCPLADAASLLGSLAHGSAFALQVILGSNTGDFAVHLSG